jgi:hypothetical protein
MFRPHPFQWRWLLNDVASSDLSRHSSNFDLISLFQKRAFLSTLGISVAEGSEKKQACIAAEAKISRH